MRVVVATGIFPPDIGGPATHAADLASELRDRGHQVVVLTLTDGRRTVVDGDLRRWPRWWPWPVRTLALASWLARHRHDYDVIYATGLDLAAVAGALAARRPVALKVVGDPAWERGRRLGLTDASFPDFQAPRDAAGTAAGRPRLRLRAMRRVRNWAVGHATVVVTPSAFLGQVVEGWTEGRQPVVVIPNGVRATVPPGEGDAPGDGLRLVYVGRLVSHKRIEVLVEAVAATPGAVLDVVGEGPEQASLEALAARLGVTGRVRFTGAVTHGEVMRRLAAADALVTATGYEGLPHVVIEALACGTPVVSSVAGGVPEVVVDGRNGLLVDPAGPHQFAAAFARLADEPVLAADLAAGALETGREWRFDRCAGLVEDLLGQLAQGRPPAVYLGRGDVAWPPNADLRRKLAIHARYLRQVSIGTGPGGLHRVSGVRALLLPRFRPRALATAAFYTAGPVAAVVTAAARRGAVVVCQSPFEAVGVAALRRLVPARRRPRLQVELHGDWRTAARLYGSPRRRLVAPLADRVAVWGLRRADRVRVVSLALADLARESGYDGPIDRHLTYSEFGTFLQPPVPPPVRPRAVFVGVLERYKAVDILLDAWPSVVARLPDAELVLVGAGSQGEALRRRAANGTVSSVRFVEPVPQPELAALIDAATCLVLPSRSEGLPRVVLEAMSRARPVVASDVGGMAELIDDTTGRLVPAEDVLALADALVAVLGDLPAAARMGATARARAEARQPTAEYEAGIARLAVWAAGG